MNRPYRAPAHHGAPKMTLDSSKARFLMEMMCSTDTALAGKTAEALKAGSYSRLPLAWIEQNLADAKRERGL